MRRSLPWLLVVLMLAFAGCATPPGPSAGPGDEAPLVRTANGGTVDTRDGTFLLQADYPLEQAEASTSMSRNGLGGANCLQITKHAHVLRGNATIAWRPGPTDPPMELFTTAENEITAIASGDDAITLDLTGVDVGGGKFDFLAWQIDADQPVGATAGVSGTLHLDIVYEADSPLVLKDNWSCEYGH